MTKPKPLRFIKEGDTFIRRETGARYRVYGVVQVQDKTYVVYQHIKTMGRARINTINHLKSWNYEIEGAYESLLSDR